MIYRRGTIYDKFLYIITVYKMSTSIIISHMCRRAVSEPDQETTISRYLISTFA